MFEMLKSEKKYMILSYLEGFEEFKEEKEVPYEQTLEGIIETTDMEKSVISEGLKNFKKKDFLEEKMKRIIGTNRKRKVYFLTEKGEERENEIWEKIKDREIILKINEEKSRLSLNKVSNMLDGRNPIVKVLSRSDENGVVDLNELGEDTDIFVGRERELKILKERLKKVKAEGSYLLLIEGEAGIGKTSLVSKLEPFSRELGFEFLNGGCQSEMSDPYLPFKEAFDEFIEEKLGVVNDSSATFMGNVDLLETKERKLFDAKKKETFYETTKHVREIAQEKPLVVFLDDLQWVDKASLDILAYMTEKLEESPVFFIGTYRREEVSEDHHLVETMYELQRKNNFEKMSLNPLSDAYIGEMIKGIFMKEEVPDDFINMVYEKTRGNPLFIKESINQMIEDDLIDLDQNRFPKKSDHIRISKIIDNVIERRVERLDRRTKKVIEVGSVIGGEIPFDLLSQTLEKNEMELLDDIDILINDRLWEERINKGTFTFSHDLIEEVVYKKIKGLKKRSLHKKVAKNIEDIYENEIEEWYSNLGRHYERGDEFLKASDYYVKAGEKAESIFANEDAVEMYEKALDAIEKIEENKTKKIDVMKKIARAYSLRGEFKKSREFLNKVLQITEDEKEEQEMYSKIAKTYHQQGDWDKSLEYVDKGLSVYDEENIETCELLSLKSFSYQKKGDYEKARDICEKEKKVAEKVGGDEELSQVYHDLGATLMRTGELEESVSNLKKAMKIREKSDDLLNLYKSMNNIAIVYMNKGDYQKSKEYFEKSLEIARKHNFNSEMGGILNNTAYLYSLIGKLDEAIELHKESAEWSEKTEDMETKALSMGNLGNVYLKKGEMNKARKYIEKAVEMMRELGYSYGLLVDLQHLGHLNKKEGKMDEALEAFKESLEVAQRTGIKRRECMSLNRLGDLHMTLGDFEEAKRYFTKAEKLAEEIGTPDTGAIAKQGLGYLHLMEGNIDEAEKYHEEGLKLAKEANDEKSLILNQIGMGEICLEKDEVKKATELSSKVTESMKNREDPELFFRNQILKTSIKIKENDFEEAERYLRETLNRAKKVRDKIWRAKTLHMKGLFHLEMEDLEKAREILQEALSRLEELDMIWWSEKTKDRISQI